MAKRNTPKLPSPQPAFTTTHPSARGNSYASIARAADRHLAKAEQAIRMASLLWMDVDTGLETTFDELASEVLRQRHDAVSTIDDLYGDRLGEAAL